MPNQGPPSLAADSPAAALALDLQMRGFVVELYERGEISAGTSGRTHGLLHSGGRYCVEDVEAGQECIQETGFCEKSQSNASNSTAGCSLRSPTRMWPTATNLQKARLNVILMSKK